MSCLFEFHVSDDANDATLRGMLWLHEVSYQICSHNLNKGETLSKTRAITINYATCVIEICTVRPRDERYHAVDE